VEFNALLTQDMFADEEVGAITVAAQGDDVGMRAEKEDVVDGVEFARGDDALLQDEGIGVRDQAKVDGE
jgi:hypothetical protein